MQDTKTCRRHWAIALYILLCLITDSTAEDFETRRAKLLEMLTSPKMLAGDIDSGGYSYRRGWQYYNACLARGIRLAEANRYFAESDEVVSGECPYMNSAHASGVITISNKQIGTLVLDFGDPAKPMRTTKASLQ